MATIPQSARRGTGRDFWSMARYQMTHVDRTAWRRFWLALFGLGMAFFLALYSTALREAGHVEGAMGDAGGLRVYARGRGLFYDYHGPGHRRAQHRQQSPLHHSGQSLVSNSPVRNSFRH